MKEEILIDEPKVSKSHRLLWAIAYLPFGFLLPFALDESSDFLAFHVKQGMALFGIYVLLMIFLSFLVGIFSLVWIGHAVVWGYKAYNWETYTYGFLEKYLIKK